MKLCWVGHFQASKLDFPLIKTLEWIRFSSNQKIGEGESNFDDWKCPTQQSFIPQEINSWKIHILETAFFSLHLQFWLFKRIKCTKISEDILLKKYFVQASSKDSTALSVSNILLNIFLFFLQKGIFYLQIGFYFFQTMLLR